MNAIASRTLNLLVASLLFACFTSTAAETLKVGDKAPLVSGKDQDGKDWKLADLIGKQNVLLYFYPKDGTPGCTKEACSFRDQLEDFKKLNVQVIGVSFDTAQSHLEFISKQRLNFPLLADTDGKITDAYGARGGDRNISRRASFLIGLDGKILHVTDTPSADVHIREMKEAVDKLKKP